MTIVRFKNTLGERVAVKSERGANGDQSPPVGKVQSLMINPGGRELVLVEFPDADAPEIIHTEWFQPSDLQPV